MRSGGSCVVKCSLLKHKGESGPSPLLQAQARVRVAVRQRQYQHGASYIQDQHQRHCPNMQHGSAPAGSSSSSGSILLTLSANKSHRAFTRVGSYCTLGHLHQRIKKKHPHAGSKRTNPTLPLPAPQTARHGSFLSSKVVVVVRGCLVFIEHHFFRSSSSVSTFPTIH